MKKRIKLGSRGSQLALWQTEWVKEKLQIKYPNLEFETEIVKTTGDKVLDSPLAKIGDKGLFTKELDIALLENRIDLAVHSMKDVPTQFPEELVIGAVTDRWDVRDALISKNGILLEDLPKGASLATGSLRRKAQLLHHRPDFEIIDIRGNLNTRFRKFDESDWDGMVLASAGVERLQMGDRISQKIPSEYMLPAVGQGCFAVMTNCHNEEVLQLIKAIHQPIVAAGVFAERSLLRVLEGGCQVPLGALGEIDGNSLRLRGCVASLDGQAYFANEVMKPIDKPIEAGKLLAEKLIDAGANRILDEIRSLG